MTKTVSNLKTKTRQLMSWSDDTDAVTL